MANEGKNALEQQIDRIKNNIADCYDACSEKNATMPSVQNSDNLAETIRSIVLSSTDITQIIGDFAKYNIKMVHIANGIYELVIDDYEGQISNNYFVGDITYNEITSLYITNI